MNRTYWRWTFVSFCVALLVFHSPAVAFPSGTQSSSAATIGPVDPEIEKVKERYRDYFLQPDYPEAQEVLKSQKPDGSWADINYDDHIVSAWQPGKHIDRVKQLAGAYAKKGNPSYHDKAMLAGVEKGLQFWYARKPKSDNWWHNFIGQQLQFERILILLEHDLPPDLMQTGLAYFMDLSKPNSATGENLVWYAGEYLTHGLITNNEAEINGAVKVIQDTILITDKEGIQEDYSFHQHGAQLYSGGYGYGFLQDSAMYASYVEGTRFGFAQDKIDLLSAYALDGCRWMMRGPMFDYGANGRGLVRPPGAKPKTTANAKAARRDEFCEQLGKLVPSHKADYAALQASMRGEGSPCTVEGNRQFYRSDFMVQQTKDLYMSVKMNSSRTNGIEVINGENLKGYWLPFGCTYIAPTGKEYAGVFPVWDWGHIPGVTSPAVALEPVNGFKQPNAFVGGVSDGKTGACAMVLDLDSPGKNIHARKSWFFLGNVVVALGSGISSTEDTPVDTTLNQTLLKGEVKVDGKTIKEGTRDLKGVTVVQHDKINYIFPSKADIHLGNTTQTGTYQSISSSTSPDPVSEKVFSLWLNHGVKPVDGNYEYMVVAGAMPKELGVHVLVHTKDLEAVRDDKRRITQAIFYAPGEVAIRPDLKLKVDQPCMVQVTEGKIKPTIVLASPTSGGQVHLTLGDETTTFDLPVDPSAGKSQTKEM